MTSDPDQIREQIEETRSNLSQDVNTGRHGQPGARRQAHSCQRAFRRNGCEGQGDGDCVALGLRHELRHGREAVSGSGTARRQASGNPLAVGLIAAGAGWLLGSLLPATSAEQQVAVKVKDAATPAVTGAAKEVGASLQDSAQQAAESVKATATDAAATVRDQAASSAHDLRDQAQAARDAVTDSHQ